MLINWAAWLILLMGGGSPQLASIFLRVLWKQAEGNVARGGINRASGNRNANRWSVEGERRKVTQSIECYGTRSLMQASRLDELEQLKYRCRERERGLSHWSLFICSRLAVADSGLVHRLTSRGVRELSSNFSLSLSLSLSLFQPVATRVSGISNFN